MANETPGTPFTKEAMLAELEKLQEPERIGLRTSAPVPRGPAATPDIEMGHDEEKNADSRWLVGFENELIDLKAANEAKKAAAAQPVKPMLASTPSLPEIENKNRLGTEPAKPAVPVATVEAKVKQPEKPVAEKPLPIVPDVDRPVYPTRLMVPETIAMVAVVIGWTVYAIQWLPTKLQTWEMYALLPGTLLLFETIRFGYRLIAGGYQVTPKQLLRIEPKPFRNPEPIDLTTIAGIQVQQTMWEWMLFADKLRLSFERGTQADVVVGPVSLPKRRAALMQQAIDNARQGNVIGVRAKIG